MALNKLTLREASDKLAAKEISSVELTQSCLDQIEKHDKNINAFVTVDTEKALAAAKAADARIAAGNAAPMTGIPIAHKDIFNTADMRTTCSSRMLENFVPPFDATITTNLREAGAVILGKANMDEFAMGSSTESSHFGASINPWDTERTPGGSSGGSSAAVAANMAICATGTDTGGSIRQPAAFTNLTGMKPTYGRCSRFGIIAFASSLDQAGPMARSAEDAAMLLSVMASYDRNDSTSINAPVPDYTQALTGEVKGLKIGIPSEYFGEGLDDEVRAAVEAAQAQYQSMGAELVPISMPNSNYAIPTYYIIAPAEASSNLARYDGVKYGYRCDDPRDIRDLYFRSRSEGFGEEVKRRIMLGTYVLSSGYYDAYYRKAQKARRLISNEFKEAFEKVDVILTPTTPSTAFKFGEKDDPIQMYLSDIYTINGNLSGLPGISVPCGFDGKGLPIGLQLIGKALDEETLLRSADAYQRETDWHTRRVDLG
ncbi:Asp-tRNA(Asn)/Glu-tRNA(Gln) amidotransferase subunit GatA [Magnetococcus sp. PR-3]|uniref:Asp-tRNA(Asn)/Glu-tRNA(Gln) amidotransferase subunit GatA n=1 Tax=Magnetococcus sp. PR-3 TaxID=3120355 RepID=UPI002FCE2721